jgi:hypothetical protein
MMRTRSRLQGDSGAVVAEAALVMPLLVVLLCGIIDYGGAFREEVVIQSAVRNANRAAATASGLKIVPATPPPAPGTQPGAVHADQLALSSLRAGLTSTSDRIDVERVVIYRANGQPGGRLPPTCVNIPATGAKAGLQGLCNVYSLSQMDIARNTPNLFTRAGTACATAGWDAFYCPFTRPVNVSTNVVDQVGVHVDATYEPFTGLFASSTMEISDYSVMAVEPNPRAS